MKKTRGQNSTDPEYQHDDRDTRINRRTDLVERFLERDLRREAEHPQPPPLPLPLVPPRSEGLDSVSVKF